MEKSLLEVVWNYWISVSVLCNLIYGTREYKDLYVNGR